MTKIATWNVNSVKARIGHVLDYLKQAKPDVLLLQEVKCLDGGFPRLEIESMGYSVETVGQKSYNGVAILAKGKIGVVVRRLPGDKTDDQARYIEAGIGDWRVASIYLPNGNPAPGEKFAYKLAWLERLYAHVARLLTEGHRLVLGGDYNVAPTDTDVYDPRAWAEDALCRPESRAAFRKLLYLGLTDAVRALHPQPGIYTYWDYMQNRFPKDEGLRIDHLLLSPEAADRLNAAGVDKGPRAKDKASDHTPVWCDFKD